MNSVCSSSTKLLRHVARATVFLLAAWATWAQAQTASSVVESKANLLPAGSATPAAIPTIRPVFSQLVLHPLPPGLVPAFQDAKPNFYIEESVPQGETVHAWTQMLTLTGGKDLAPRISLMRFAAGMAAGFQRACPQTFATQSITADAPGDRGADPADRFSVYIACGRLNREQGAYSEAMVMTLLRGSADIYTLQWAERGPAVDAPPRYDAAKWQPRLQQMAPLRLCDKLTGEAPPYPHCLERP